MDATEKVRLKTRIWKRLRWLEERYSEFGYSDCALWRFPSETLARFLEECGQLQRLGLITVNVIQISLTGRSLVQPGSYQEYLKTPEWLERRTAAIEFAGHHCQVCNAQNSILDVHHRTYERLGREEPADLIVLCRDCHQLFHDNGKLARH